MFAFRCDIFWKGGGEGVFLVVFLHFLFGLCFLNVCFLFSIASVELNSLFYFKLGLNGRTLPKEHSFEGVGLKTKVVNFCISDLGTDRL